MMTFWQALKAFALDVPNLVIGITFGAIAWVLADAAGRDPDWAETIWFGLSAAGFYYHWVGLSELLQDKVAIKSWRDHDQIDLEAVENQIRRERARLTTKGLFAASGLIMMFVPPRALANLEDITQLVIVMLIVAVVALDVDASLDKRSRRRQLDLIRQAIKRRQARREILEKQFLPIFETVANETSAKGRVLIHDINGRLSVMLGCIEILRASTRLDSRERDLVMSLDDVIAEVITSISELQQMVRDLAIKSTKDDPSESTLWGEHGQ